MEGAGIGETVSEIEPRRVASLAIAVEGVERMRAVSGATFTILISIGAT